MTTAYDLSAFPDIEVALMDLVEARFPQVVGNVGTETPSDLQARLPFVRIGLVAASDDRLTSYSAVDIDVFTPDRQSGYVLAEQIRQMLLGYPLSVGTVTLDRVVTETAPFQAPWEDENVRRRLATYRISTRR